MNEEQVAYWNGPAGKRWTDYQIVLDRALAAFGRAVLEVARAQPGEDVLDIGCGTGETSRALAEQVAPTGSVIGIDISQPMLARAREHSAARSNLTFREGDAAASTFPETFELLFSRFGVMFFEDPVAAFRNLHAAAAGGGRLAFVCWRPLEDNPWAALPLQAVRKLVPDVVVPIGDGPGPYAFADASKVQTILVAAGFRDLAIERFDAEVILAGQDIEEAVQFAVGSGPASRALANASAEVQAQARVEVRRVLEKTRNASGFTLAGSTWLVTARA